MVFTLSIGFLFIMIVTVLMSTTTEIKKMALSSEVIEKALKQSALSALIYDTTLYGETHEIKINDIDTSYNNFLSSIQEGLYLGTDNISKNNRYIVGKLEVAQFIVYSVVGNDIYTSTRGKIGTTNKTLYKGQKGIIKTPTGVVVKDTSVFIEIEFDVSVFGKLQRASKNSYVAITQNN